MYSLRLKTLQDHVNYLTALIDWDTRWIEVGYSKQVEKLVEAEDFIRGRPCGDHADHATNPLLSIQTSGWVA